MKDIIKLIKTDVSILGILLAVILFAIGDYGYIKDDFSQYKIYGAVESISEQEVINLCGGSELFQGIDYTQALRDKFENSSICGMNVLFLGIMMVVLLKRMLFFDRKRQEFQKTLPIKQTTWAIYDYVSGLFIIFLGILIFSGLLVHHQTRLNENILEAAIQHGITSYDKDMITVANERLLVYLAFYLILLILIYSYITLFVTLSKNAIAGVILAGGCGLAIYWLFDMIFYDYYYELVLEGLSSSPFWITQRLQEYGCSQFDATFWNATGVYIVAIVLLVLGIIVVSKKRELSKGRIFCFSIMEFAFVILVFMLIAVILGELIDMFWLISMGLGLIIGAFVYYLMTKQKKASNVWEVK